MSKFDNTEMEIYPLITLSYAFPEFVQNFKKSESPDWSDVESETGIEIARSEDENLGFATYFSNQYIGKAISDVSERDCAKFQGEIYCDKGKIWAIKPNRGLEDGQRHIALALSRAEGKLALLNKVHFRVFHTNCLYLYMTFPLSDDDCYVFLQEYSRMCEKYEHSYCLVFLMANKRIVRIDFNNCILSTYVFSSEEKSIMDDDAHLLRKSTSWSDNSPFEYEVKQIERGYYEQITFDELERNPDNEIAHQQYNRKYNKECFTL